MQLVDQYGKPFPRVAQRKNLRVRGSYDAAQTTDDNKRHWENADSSNANAANDPATRQTIRDRARYERANNGYADGVVSTVANDTIGTGPRLQLGIPGIDRSISRQIERLFALSAEQIDLADDLRTGAETKMVDGEVFGLHISNPALDPFLPQLDLRLYEADQISTPDLFRVWDPTKTDGIVFDDYGNPVEYHFLKNHPGGEWGIFGYEYDRFPANRVAHWFKSDRPGQARGISELTPALPLFAQLRRFTLAVLNSAEFAASLTGLLETETVPTYSSSTGEDDEVAVASFDRFPVDRGTLATLPKGWKASQLKPEQPVSTYEMFKSELLNEIGRALNVPFNVIAGNSSRYNYSSGRLDHLIYHRMIRVERARLASRVLNPFFRSWLSEAFIMGILPDGLPPIAMWRWSWHYDGFESIDPVKESQAQQIRLASGTTTYAAEYATDGLDWEEQFEQQALEQRRRAELGLPTPAAPAPVPVQTIEEDANVPA